MSIWETAITWRVNVFPGWKQARLIGNSVMAPPRNTAAQTCRWNWLYWPDQVRGVIHSAAARAASHWQGISQANRRSVRQWIAWFWSVKRTAARRVTLSGSPWLFNAFSTTSPLSVPWLRDRGANIQRLDYGRT